MPAVNLTFRTRNLAVRPGMTVNLTGGDYDPAWAAMNAVVQSRTVDWAKGEATVVVGASGQYSFSDVIERARHSFYMRPWNSQQPTSVKINSPLGTPGNAAGIGASVACTGSFFQGLDASLTVSFTMGPSPTGTLLADILLPVQVSSRGFTISVTPQNAAATTLNPTFTPTSTTSLRISKNVNSAVNGSTPQFSLVLLPVSG